MSINSSMKGTEFQASSIHNLGPLPPKKYEPYIKPGDTLGNLLYICDKPLGIEDGEICIPIDSKGYREFITKQLNDEKKEKYNLQGINDENYLDVLKTAISNPELSQDLMSEYFNHLNISDKSNNWDIIKKL